jgi:hypothetical protein
MVAPVEMARVIFRTDMDQKIPPIALVTADTVEMEYVAM